MKNEIKKYFQDKKANFERCGHPYYNDSVLTKIGNKYLYFLTRSGVKKVEMESFFNAHCRPGF